MMLHCAYTSTGVPVLPQNYEYSDRVESSNNYSHHHPVNVEPNVPSQHSPHAHSPSLSIPRTLNSHPTVIQSSNATEGGDQSHYHFHSSVPVPHSPYHHNVNNQSPQYYHRQENPNYTNSPNSSHAMSLSTGLPYISKMSQIPPTSRRPNLMVSSHELLPIPNRSRLESPGISARYSQLSISKSDPPEGFEIPRHIPQAEPSGSSSCTAFISKLYHLCGHDEYRPYIHWNVPGDAFVLAHANTEFATTILPKFFRHSNVSSFIRQLNLYNFTRLPTIKLLDQVDKIQSKSSSPTLFSGFSHPHFHRGDEESLGLIKPKPNRNKIARKLSKCPMGSDEKSSKPIRKNASFPGKL